MFEFIDISFQKRRLATAGVGVATMFLLVCSLAPAVQTYRASVAAQVQASYSSQAPPSMDDSPNAITNALFQLVNTTGNGVHVTGIRALGGIMSLATAITQFDRSMAHGAQVAVTSTLHNVAGSVARVSYMVGGIFRFTGHAIRGFFGLFHGLPSLRSVIQPQAHTKPPVITELQAHQAALIQSGTKDVSVTSVSSGVGGACDNSDGNGGYPMSWCNAPMDTVSTVPYGNDPINRECTSYAYWYFTSIEGRTDFHVSGDAKYWAATSNYATHAIPSVGAIAVETTGAYGHVAIVQALPGQTYAGRVVPAGYVLVSEMNYDWNGHFRYSYSPLSKFSAFIYR